jgi:hypothetical protein
MTLGYQRFTALLLSMAISFWVTSECVLVCRRERRENVRAWIRALSMSEFLASKQTTVLEHPPYSPYQAPNYFFLFSKIKEILKRSILLTLMALGVIRRQLWRPFHKTSANIFWRVDLELASVHSFPTGVLWRPPQWYSAIRYVALLL